MLPDLCNLNSAWKPLLTQHKHCGFSLIGSMQYAPAPHLFTRPKRRFETDVGAVCKLSKGSFLGHLTCHVTYMNMSVAHSISILNAHHAKDLKQPYKPWRLVQVQIVAQTCWDIVSGQELPLHVTRLSWADNQQLPRNWQSMASIRCCVGCLKTL